MPTPRDPERTPGRPRDPATEERILAVTLRLLAADGYSRMSLDTVAEEAGVSKPTIYRRWSSKADLATAALGTLRLQEPLVDTGSGLEDLAQLLENFARSLLRPNGLSLVGTVLAEEAHTPELLELFRERLVAPRRALLREALRRAQRRGELRRDTDLDCATNMAVGAFYARYLVDSKVPRGFARQVAETVWRGVAKVSDR
jgi:AcrR family transcriptional regulator